MGQFTDVLGSHADLASRLALSQERLGRVRTRLEGCRALSSEPATVFCAGSFARGEAGPASDLDLFISTENLELARSRLRGYELIAELIHVNADEGFPSFSNDGQYLRVYLLEDLESQTGSPEDDEGNYFTARMLMLLEAQPLLAESAYRRQQRRLIEHYFRDGKGKKDFKPLFLLNDTLRYWRTLCLNYEQTRHDTLRRWRKKNVNLKFGRMVTVFSTVLPLISLRGDRLQPESPLWTLRPLERLALALDELDDGGLASRWPEFLDAYGDFLGWKEAEDIEARLGEVKSTIEASATEVSQFLYEALHHPSIPEAFQRYLVL